MKVSDLHMNSSPMWGLGAEAWEEGSFAGIAEISFLLELSSSYPSLPEININKCHLLFLYPPPVPYLDCKSGYQGLGTKSLCLYSRLAKKVLAGLHVFTTMCYDISKNSLTTE